MKIDEVTKALCDKWDKAPTGISVTNLTVYMSEEFYKECLKEGWESNDVNVRNLAHTGRLLGIQVWRVLPTHTTEGENIHPPFVIKELNV